MTQNSSFLRLASGWLAGVALAVVLVALFVLVAGAQLTSEGAGTRIHRRSVATLTDLDARLPEIEAALDAASEDSQNTSVQVPDFPVPVELTAEEARTLRGADLREHILDEAATSLYDRGMSQWAESDPRIQNIERVSAAGAIKEGLGMVRDSRHTLILSAAVLLGVVALLLAAGMLLAVRDWNLRLIAVGSVVIAAALPCLAAAIGVRFGFKTAQTDADPFTEAMLDLGIDAMWVPIRDYLVLGSLGFAIAGLGALGSWVQARAAREPAPSLPPAE